MEFLNSKFRKFLIFSDFSCYEVFLSIAVMEFLNSKILENF